MLGKRNQQNDNLPAGLTFDDMFHVKHEGKGGRGITFIEP